MNDAKTPQDPTEPTVEPFLAVKALGSDHYELIEYPPQEPGFAKTMSWPHDWTPVPVLELRWWALDGWPSLEAVQTAYMGQNPTYQPLKDSDWWVDRGHIDGLPLRLRVGTKRVGVAVLRAAISAARPSSPAKAELVAALWAHTAENAP